MKKSGFTIIELIVVIAIITVIGSIVIVLMSQPKNDAQNVAVRSNINSISKQAELYYIDNGNSYGDGLESCNEGVFSDITITAGLIEIANNLNSPKGIVCRTSSNGSAWAVELNKLHDKEIETCADSTGYFGDSSGIDNGACVQ